MIAARAPTYIKRALIYHILGVRIRAAVMMAGPICQRDAFNR